MPIFSSETQLPNEQNLVGSTYGKLYIRFPQNRMKSEQQSVENIKMRKVNGRRMPSDGKS
jgi:hypothetical protein